MSAGLSDTHCHLNLDVYTDDFEQVLNRARSAGLSRILVPGVDLDSSVKAIDLASSTPEIFAAVGVHPHYADQWSTRSANALRTLAASEKVVAIGEIGLDYYRDLSPRVDQQRAFIAQIEIALELELPVIVHQRDSLGEILDTLLQYDKLIPGNLKQRRGVFHAYSGNASSASIALAKGFYLGVAGPVTFKKASGLRETLAGVPKERILIETDSPYMTPEPFRGKRNEPGHVRYIADRLAAIYEIHVDLMVQIAATNSDILFRW